MSGYFKRFSISVLLMCLMLNAAWSADDRGPLVWFNPTTKEMTPDSEMNFPTQVPEFAKDSTIGKNFTTTITYQDVIDSSGFGFDDAVQGTARRAVIVSVFTYLDSVLGQAANNLDVHLNASTNFPSSPTLASASTAYLTGSPGYQSGIAFEKIVLATDANGTGPEITINVNFGHLWNANPGTGTTAGSEFDLFTVMLHEITHGLGIANLTNSDGTSFFFAGSGNNIFSVWENSLYQTSGTVKIWDDPLSNVPATDYNLAANGLFQGDNTLEFRGPQTIANFGSAPPVYSPIVYAPGSSIGHWQQNAPIPGTAVMRPAVATGVENRTLDPFELVALRDLGYINAVPVTVSSFEIE